MPNKVLESIKYQWRPQKNEEKCFSQKKAHLIFYLKLCMASVNLILTSFTGICLEHQLLIFGSSGEG